MAERDARGYDEIVGALCLEHVTDPHLRAALEGSVSEHVCVACGKDSDDSEPFAVPLDALMAPLMEVIRFLFASADTLPWDAEDHTYIGDIVDASDVLNEVCDGAIEPEAFEKVFEVLLAAIEGRGDWTEIGASADPEHLELAWETFAEIVKHTSRFVMVADPDQEHWSPAFPLLHFLQNLRAYVDDEALGLVQSLPEGTQVYRGRLVERPGEVRHTAADLGPAPRDRASANRMSPAGVSVFYASEDPETAVAEIAAHGPRPYAVIGAFRSTRELSVLDLTRTPEGVSMFDTTRRESVVRARFLKRFVRAVTIPVIPDGREHVEYAPTQVLTEYLRWVPARRIDGIALPSAQTGVETGVRTTYVFFVGPEEVADEPVGSNGQAEARNSRTLWEALGEDQHPVFTLSEKDVALYEVIRSYGARLVPPPGVPT